MKFSFSNSTLIVLFASFLFSCNGSKQQNDAPNDITYDSIAITRKYHLENDTNKPFCYIDITYMYPSKYSDAGILSKLQQELNTTFMEDSEYATLSPTEAVNKYVADYIKNYQQEIQLFRSHLDDEDESDDMFYFSKRLTNRILLNQNDLIVYQVESVDSKNNTDTITTYKNVVMDLKSGNRVNEEDIFVPEYKKALNTLIIKKVVEQNKVQKPEDLFEMGYWGAEDMDSNNNFSVDKKGITYIFNQGEYSAPRLGRTIIFFPYSEIKDLLKDGSPITSLINN